MITQLINAQNYALLVLNLWLARDEDKFSWSPDGELLAISELRKYKTPAIKWTGSATGLDQYNLRSKRLIDIQMVGDGLAVRRVKARWPSYPYVTWEPYRILKKPRYRTAVRKLVEEHYKSRGIEDIWNHSLAIPKPTPYFGFLGSWGRYLEPWVGNTPTQPHTMASWEAGGSN